MAVCVARLGSLMKKRTIDPILHTIQYEDTHMRQHNSQEWRFRLWKR
jgi:hypothetical protein